MHYLLVCVFETIKFSIRQNSKLVDKNDRVPIAGNVLPVLIVNEVIDAWVSEKIIVRFAVSQMVIILKMFYLSFSRYSNIYCRTL